MTNRDGILRLVRQAVTRDMNDRKSRRAEIQRFYLAQMRPAILGHPETPSQWATALIEDALQAGAA